MAEGEVLGANSLGGEKRSPWYDCGNWQLGAFAQGYAPSRPTETAHCRGFDKPALLGFESCARIRTVDSNFLLSAALNSREPS
jgi:hypothetical protein